MCSEAKVVEASDGCLIVPWPYDFCAAVIPASPGRPGGREAGRPGGREAGRPGGREAGRPGGARLRRAKDCKDIFARACGARLRRA